ncbi:DUF5994 family protein [Streptomyces marispadix]|uniref:DUF5994 family protein n=1 Tax=Streptomyces marispadix TaxID=2922868 RepID=A0ABS9SVZ1_9ACTN|nr:DUF5994 family protein [Streptomyces marispadix]MCH6160221.1 DUF5994 family protein [Streptomyces marispadix]
MSVTADRALMIHEPFSPPPLRLALKPEGAPAGLLDGAWWPHSRDLLRELPALTDVLDPLWGRITRIAVNPTHWPVVPRKIPVNGHVVKAGWFTTEQDRHQLLLRSYRVGRWDLLVMPPRTAAAAAARLMAAATDSAVHMSASAIIAADEAAQSEESSRRAREEEWEPEGGTVPAPSAMAVNSVVSHAVVSHAVAARQGLTAPARSFGA